MTILVYGASVALALFCIALFFLGSRRLVGRHEQVVVSMLRRFDDRLVAFAQALNDALTQQQQRPPQPEEPRSASARHLSNEQAVAPAAIQEHGVMSVLELARERMSADAAVAVVTPATKEPILATVGLSQAEVAQVGRLGVPDYRGARALQVSFNGEAETPPGHEPIRAGLAVPLLDDEESQGMLAVLTRTPDRRFSEIDITTLEDVVSGTRQALERSLELREPDPVPELDPVTDLYDRRAFHALLEREIARARAAGRPFALLMLDVDELTKVNAQVGHLAGDEILNQIGRLVRDVAGTQDLACNVGGGRYGVIMAESDPRDGERLFERLQAALHRSPFADVGVVTLSGGVAALLPGDDAPALLGRADSALGLAKASGRNTVVSAAQRQPEPDRVPASEPGPERE